MSEYERLTFRIKGIPGVGINFKKIKNPRLYNNEIAVRLAELEDKIEQGELVENNVITYMNMARSSHKTLVEKAIKFDELKAKIEQGILVEQKHCNFKVIDHYELGRIFVCLNCGKGFKFPEGDIKSNNYSYCPICGCKIEYDEEDL